MSRHPFEELGLGRQPLLLAPLAGVSDAPFRLVCQQEGADLSYVEMLSAAAICSRSPRTFAMMSRHPGEPLLGVQVSSRNPEEMAEAASVLNDYPFDTLDLNMGCPVRKVVGVGGGSAILKDPERVYQTVRAAVQNFSRPVSVKIRLGWDHNSRNWQEVSQAACEGGTRWITVHGRTRSDSYADPVDLEAIAQLKASSPVPVIGNGNIFSSSDADFFREKTGVDGLMISRGALGNPWLFRDIKGISSQVSKEEWYESVMKHLQWQEDTYGERESTAICMRKHILWYLSGWPDSRKFREKFNKIKSISEVRTFLEAYFQHLCEIRADVRCQGTGHSDQRFLWDPKYDMDRSLDRGVGDDDFGSERTD